MMIKTLDYKILKHTVILEEEQKGGTEYHMAYLLMKYSIR